MTDIKNIETYIPGDVPDEQLRDDWRIVCAWWSQIVQGREFTYSKEQVINLAHLIVTEMKKRDMEFHTEEMKPAAKQLFELVEKGELSADERDLAPFGSSGETMGDRIFLKDVLTHFKDFYVSKPAIYLVGGLCNHPEDGTTGDIDILIRHKKPGGNDLMPMVFRLYRMFPRNMWDRIQILWSDEDFGPFTNFIPLYDQVFELRKDSKQIVLMSSAEGMSPIEEETDPVFEKAVLDETKKVEPLRFFTMLKGIAGYRKMEKFSIPGVLKVLNPKDYPYEVDEKYDGMRLQLHKKGDRVKIYSLNKEDLTDRLPFMVKELDAFSKSQDVVLDAELTGWTEGFRKGRHLGRSDVAGMVLAKAPLPHTNFYANVFDVLYLKDRATNTEPLSKRREALESLKSTDHIKIIQVRVAKDDDDMIKAIKWAAAFPGSEGAMIKSLASTYPLSGMTSKWIKFKVESDIDAEILQVEPVKGAKAWNYLCIIRTAKGDPVPVGRTYNTPIAAKKGDIIRVAFGNLNMYTDPKTDKTWFNWVFPRVIEKREDKTKPDSDFTARNLNKETNGEVGEKPYPKRYREVMNGDVTNDLLLNATLPVEGIPPELKAELQELVKDADPFLEPGDEDKIWKFVLQDHYRGKSVHGDLRMERPSFLVGWTLNYQIEGKPGSDINTMEEGTAFSKNPDNFKPMNSPDQLVVQKKAPEPPEWLTYKGVMKPGEVGATKEHEGVFVIGANGTVEFGAQKPTFHEYWLKSTGGHRDFSGRLVVRLLKNVWKKDPEMKTGRGSFVWMAWFADDDTPYVLTKRAVDTDAMPPEGASWLPKYIRNQVPKELRYWTMKGAKAKDVRAELSTLWRTKKLKLNIRGVDKDDFPKSGKFTLSHICWRGPVVVRLGCSRQEWHMFIEDGSKALDLVMDQDPTENKTVPFTFGSKKGKAVLSLEGKLPNRTDLNPDKTTPAFIEILERGTYTTLEDKPGEITVKLEGETLKGKHTLTQEKTKNLWSFSG